MIREGATDPTNRSSDANASTLAAASANLHWTVSASPSAACTPSSGSCLTAGCARRRTGRSCDASTCPGCTRCGAAVLPRPGGRRRSDDRADNDVRTRRGRRRAERRQGPRRLRSALRRSLHRGASASRPVVGPFVRRRRCRRDGHRARCRGPPRRSRPATRWSHPGRRPAHDDRPRHPRRRDRALALGRFAGSDVRWRRRGGDLRPPVLPRSVPTSRADERRQARRRRNVGDLDLRGPLPARRDDRPVLRGRRQRPRSTCPTATSTSTTSPSMPPATR